MASLGAHSLLPDFMLSKAGDQSQSNLEAYLGLFRVCVDFDRTCAFCSCLFSILSETFDSGFLKERPSLFLCCRLFLRIWERLSEGLQRVGTRVS